MGEIIIGSLLLVLSNIVYFQASSFPVSKWAALGPDAFPKLIAICLGALSLLLIVTKIRDGVNYKLSIDPVIFFKRYKYALFTLGSFFAYIKLMHYVGFRISTFLFIMITQWVLGPKRSNKVPIMLVIAVILSLGSYYFFQSYLTVIFPTGVLFE